MSAVVTCENVWKSYHLHRPMGVKALMVGRKSAEETRFSREWALNDVSLIRWSNEFRAEEDLDGVEWSTSLNHVSSFDNNLAMIYFVSMSGLSDYDYVSRYQVGARFRRSIARPWLFLEVSPAWRWASAVARRR